MKIKVGNYIDDLVNQEQLLQLWGEIPELEVLGTDGKPMSMSQISEATDIPFHILEQLLGHRLAINAIVGTYKNDIIKH